MPRRSVLSSVEKESLLAWPTDEVQHIRLYTFSSTDLKIIRERRGEANRLGFAVQLCAMRYCAAIILWNTVYIQRAVDTLRHQAQSQASPWDDALLAHLSPLGWEHINLTGDYSWNARALPKPGHFRPLRSAATR